MQGNWQSGGTPGIGSSTSGWRVVEGRVCMMVRVAPESQAVTVLHHGQWPFGLRMRWTEKQDACSPASPPTWSGSEGKMETRPAAGAWCLYTRAPDTPTAG